MNMSALDEIIRTSILDATQIYQHQAVTHKGLIISQVQTWIPLSSVMQADDNTKNKLAQTFPRTPFVKHFFKSVKYNVQRNGVVKSSSFLTCHRPTPQISKTLMLPCGVVDRTMNPILEIMLQQRHLNNIEYHRLICYIRD